MTDEIIHLLSERNRYLSQFCVLNKVQIGRVKNKNFEQLSEFYLMREKILAVVEKIEMMINQKASEIKGAIEETKKLHIDSLLKTKDSLVKDIIDQDLEILSSIEQEKTSIITELKALKKGRKALNGYKSGLRNNKLDEEA